MPLVKDAPPRKTKSFEKKEYRAWDLFGEKTVTINSQIVPPQNNQKPFTKTEFRPTHTQVFEQVDPSQVDTQTTAQAPINNSSTNECINPSLTDTSKIENKTNISHSTPATSIVQNTLGNNKGTIREPSGNHQGTIEEPLGNSIREPLGNHQGTIRERQDELTPSKNPHQGTIRGRNREQHQGTIREPLGDGIGNKKYRISQLTGIQKSILFYIVDSCVFRGQLTSEYLTNETLRHIAKTTSESVKTTLKRLVSKGFLRREGGKPGNGGGASFSITSLLRDEVLNEKRYELIREPLGNGIGNSIREPLGNHQGPDQGTNPPSSSSSLYKTTTTSEEKQLSEEWNFDITSYEKFGFRQTHQKQLAQLGVILAADVEQSLIEFNFDLENNFLPPIRTSKINLLMGLFRQGNVYLSEHYKSEQQAITALMAERAKKKQEKALEEQFVVWEANLSVEERTKIIHQMPPYLMVSERAKGIHDPDVKKWFMNYYLEYAQG